MFYLRRIENRNKRKNTSGILSQTIDLLRTVDKNRRTEVKDNNDCGIEWYVGNAPTEKAKRKLFMCV